eukprot:scpid30125/ scgid23053/ 
MLSVLSHICILMMAGLVASQNNKRDLVMVVETTSGMEDALGHVYDAFSHLEQRHLSKKYKSYKLVTFDSMGATNSSIFVDSPQDLAHALPRPLDLSRAPRRCTSNVLKAIQESVRAAGNCADIRVVTQSIPGDCRRLLQLQKDALMRKSSIGIYTVHNCTGPQHAYFQLTASLLSHRVHFKPTQVGDLGKLLYHQLSETKTVHIIDQVLHANQQGKIQVKFAASRELSNYIIATHCPRVASPRIRLSLRNGTNTDSESFPILASNYVSWVPEGSHTGGVWTATISDISGSCRVYVFADSPYKYGFTLRRVNVPGKEMSMLIVSGNSQDIMALTGVELRTTNDSSSLNTFTTDQGIAIGSNVVLFGPIETPQANNGYPRLYAHQSPVTDKVPVRQMADRCTSCCLLS